MTSPAILPYAQPNSPWKLRPDQEIRLSDAYRALQHHYLEQGREVGPGTLYNSGYEGMTFTLDGRKVYIHEHRGTIGLEDHATGGLSAKVEGNPKTRWVMRHAARQFGDVVPTDAEWELGYAALAPAIDALYRQAVAYASTRAVKGESVQVLEAAVHHPANAPRGLYVSLQGHYDDLIGDVGLSTARRLATEHGWEPHGSTHFGFPSQKGALYTRAYWFHDPIRS